MKNKKKKEKDKMYIAEANTHIYHILINMTKLEVSSTYEKSAKHTLEALVVETDLAEGLLLGAIEAGWDSLPSDEGNRGVPGGVRSLLTPKCNNYKLELQS